jgi:hypothetical protein
MSTEPKTWEQHVREARAIEQPSGAAPITEAVLLRAEFARRLEGAHERAVREAEQLVDDAARLLMRLREGGLGALVSGNNFLGQAQTLREALVALEGSREVLSTALRCQKLEERRVTRDG